jgi:hypothetical protein
LNILSEFYRWGLRNFFILSGHAGGTHVSYLIDSAETFVDIHPDTKFFVADIYKLLQPFLKDLPENPYELFYWKKAKVHPDCCFTFKKNFYSVPHRYVGKEIELKFNQRMIYAFYQSKQIKCHATVSDSLRHQYKIYILYLPISCR